MKKGDATVLKIIPLKFRTENRGWAWCCVCGTGRVFRSTITVPVRIIRRVFVVHGISFRFGVYMFTGLRLTAVGVVNAP